jgi:hypothetical protein
MMDEASWNRAAYHRRKGKGYDFVPAQPTEPTSAAARMEAEFERRRGDALALARRRARLKPYKLLAVQLAGGKVKKP